MTDKQPDMSPRQIIGESRQILRQYLGVFTLQYALGAESFITPEQWESIRRWGELRRADIACALEIEHMESAGLSFTDKSLESLAANMQDAVASIQNILPPEVIDGPSGAA